MKIIVLTGLTGAGKSSISTSASKKFDIPTLETGTFVYQAVKDKGLPITSENIKSVTNEAKKISDAYFTERLIEAVRKDYASKKSVFVSGVRAYSEVEFLKREFGADNVMVVGFHASQDTRFHRLSNLDRQAAGGSDKAAEDSALRNFDNFLQREKKELGFGIGTVFAMADHIISNDDKKYPFYNVEHNIFVFESIVREFTNP